MKTFDDLNLKWRGREGSYDLGVQAIEFFDNGYGVSVIQSSFSYGGKTGLYELAVLRGNPSEWDLCYDTPVTSDVCGYLTKDDVTNKMAEVQKLS